MALSTQAHPDSAASAPPVLWGAGDDDTAMACDVYAWCTVCASSDSCANVELVAATAMHDLYKLENRCKSRDACLPPHTHGS